MTLIQISLITTLLSSFLITVYPDYADKKDWAIDSLFVKESGIVRILGGLFIVVSMYMMLFYFHLLVAIGIFLVFAIVGFLLIFIFKRRIQVLSLIGLISGIGMGAVYYLI